jgi:hypothetical protein
MDVLDRLYRRLVENLTNAPREAGGIRVTIGEIYQTVVPYRGVRGDLGLAELAAYEHTLLRLLAGERDYVSLEPEVQEELRRELRAPNPILGIYRDYADVPVKVNPYIRIQLDEPMPPPPSAAARIPAPPPSTAQPRPARPAGGADAPTVPRPPLPAAANACPGCRSTLPDGDGVRFCPFCGRPVKPVPCAECGAALEPEWVYCVQCGRARPPRDPAPPGPARPEQRLR